MSTIIYETIRPGPDEVDDVIAEVEAAVPDFQAIVIDSITARSVYELRDGVGNVSDLRVESYEYRVKAVI